MTAPVILLLKDLVFEGLGLEPRVLKKDLDSTHYGSKGLALKGC